MVVAGLLYFSILDTPWYWLGLVVAAIPAILGASCFFIKNFNL
jgi:hypothetical protein